MSEQTERTPLQTIEAFEAAAFRAAHIGRMLIEEHPGIPVWEMRLSLYAHPRVEGMRSEVEISVWETEGVQAWADVLGAEVDVRFHDDAKDASTFEYHRAEVARSGVTVSVVGTRQPTAAELEAWRAAKAGTSAGGAR